MKDILSSPDFLKVLEHVPKTPYCVWLLPSQSVNFFFRWTDRIYLISTIRNQDYSGLLILFGMA